MTIKPFDTTLKDLAEIDELAWRDWLAPSATEIALIDADLATVDDSSVETPVGTTGADPATDPDTTDSDLQQVGTEPIMDPSLTNAIKSDADIGARAADPDKG